MIFLIFTFLISNFKALRGVIGKTPRSERFEANANGPSEIGKFNIAKNPEISSIEITNPPAPPEINPPAQPEVDPIQNTTSPAKISPIENEVKIKGGDEISSADNIEQAWVTL